MEKIIMYFVGSFLILSGLVCIVFSKPIKSFVTKNESACLIIFGALVFVGGLVIFKQHALITSLLQIINTVK